MQICHAGINKFISILREDVYSYEYMDNWKKLNETSLRKNEKIYSNLSIKDIIFKDYQHEKKV